jgi:two-component system chemotaxis response regulator CheY
MRKEGDAMSLFEHAGKDTRKKLEDLKVLVIDDQPEVRALVRDVLADAGIARVFEASNAKDALDLMSVDDDMVNFIISDWNMPGITGISFLRQVRTTHPDIPFLMVTGRADMNSVVEARNVGVSAYIRKPFSPRQLEEKIRALIEQDS